MPEEEMVTIPKAAYEALLEQSFMLEALDGAGVDNWDGYEFALDDVEEIRREFHGG
jgi:hypothetical protein